MLDLELCFMKRLPDGCHLQDALLLRSAPPFCAKCLNRSALRCRPVSGPLSNAASPKSQCSDINAPVKFRPLWKQFSLLLSFLMILVSIEADPQPRFCTVCNTFKSERETFFCWWEPQKARFSFSRTLSASVGKLAVHTSMGRLLTRWPMTAVVVNIASGPQRRVFGARSCVRATISERVGPILRRPPFDFPAIAAFR